MNDLDITGPLPVVQSADQPPGWIPAGRQPGEAEPEPLASSSGLSEPEEDHAPAGGADPDLPWDFATVNPPEADVYDAGPATADLPVVPVATDDERADLSGPVIPLTDETPGTPFEEVPATEEPALAAGAPKSRHGQPAPLSRAWNAGIAAIIAVAAVVVGIIAFHYTSSSPSATGPGPAFVLPTAAAAGSAVASSPPGLAELPKASATGKPGSTSATAGTAASGAAVAAGVPAGAPSVTVLNETATHGLAAAEAEKLRGAGWTVRRVTNINARLTQTTVYYDTSQEAAAKALVASVPSIKVALPRPSYVLSTGGLIVVVANDAG